MDNPNNNPDIRLTDSDASPLSIIKGRVEPHIYAFRIESFPPSYKIGDTFRGVDTRIDEWRRIYAGLPLTYRPEWKWNATVEDKFFRDYAVHRYLEKEKGRKAMEPGDFAPHHASKEFYLDTEITEIEEAVEHVRANAASPDSPYRIYSADTLKEEDKKFRRNLSLQLRSNQKRVVDNFVRAFDAGRRRLLMYAVMRFGKTFTALCCALRKNIRTVLVVSAKADVATAWKENAESIIEFKNFYFFDKKNLSDLDFDKEESDGNTVVLFMTLQDLQGLKIKSRHKKIFDRRWEMLIVDESHFGARAPQYGIPILDTEIADAREDRIGQQFRPEVLDMEIKHINRDVTLHLSGTPYRILMTNEFSDDDLIACVRYPDIINARDEWFAEHIDATDENGNKLEEWDNPYFGFPQMVRFAFNLNKESLEAIKALEKQGASVKFSELFRTEKTGKDNKSLRHRKFVHESPVISFLQTIDGTKDDENVLGFLDNDRIKQGKLCRHIVMVLPFRASCDAMAALIDSNRAIFKNLGDYKIINIAGHDASGSVLSFTRQIAEAETNNEKTLSLTVRRMLTGVTVPQWDTMIFLKETFSPEEYDQAVFRIQNRFIKTYANSNGSIVKYNMKPQTLLVDFDPQRMYTLQERKCFIYSSSRQFRNKKNLTDFIEEELDSSPIITLDHHKLRRIDTVDLIDEVRKYARARGIPEEAQTIPADDALLQNKDILKAIASLNNINAKGGISKKANGINGEGDDGKPSTDQKPDNNGATITGKKNDKRTEVNSIAQKLATYYSLILYFAFLTPDRVTSLRDLIDKMDSAVNRRIARHIGIKRHILEIIASAQPWTIFQLNKSISDTNYAGNRSDLSREEMVDVVLKRCSRLSDSEIVTPAHIADEMVALLPEDLFEGEGIVLDIASKQGEFAVALKKRYGEKYPEECRTRIYSLCTSGLAYEFTRKTYEYLGFDVDNIVSDKTSYYIIADKLANKKNGKYPTTKELLGKDMNIRAIIGNPPYHVTTENTSDTPIYHYFMDASYHLSMIANLITPARYIFNAGKTPSKWNKERLSDNHFSIAKYEAFSANVFPNINIPGGLAVSLRNAHIYSQPIMTYTAFTELNSILKKVSGANEDSISSIIYLQNKFNLKVLFEKYPNLRDKIGSDGREKRLTTSIFSLSEIFEEDKPSDGHIRILGLDNNQRVWRTIDESLLATHPNTHKWKVFLPKSNGSGAIGEVIPTPLIGEPLVGAPGEGITQSFISFGAFDSKQEAEAMLKYLKTGFVRALLGILKTTQDNNRETWEYVPMQNFSDNTEIDWSMTVDQINKKLYQKYGLLPDETDFIDKMIKPMQ